MQALWEANQDSPRYQPGKWCDYCNALPHCRHAAAWSVVVTQPVNRELVFPDPNTLSVQDRIFIHEKGSMIDKFLKAVKASLKELPEDELAKYCWGLGKESNKRIISDNVNAFKILEDTYGHDVAVKLSSFSLKSVAEFLKEQNQITKKESEAAAEDLLKNTITLQPIERKLKPL
jgi:hypothetical protein